MVAAALTLVRPVIDVAFTAARLRTCEIAVVIDVLRATSTITQALASGYRRVLCAESIERARTLAAPGRVLAGERRCVMPDGFQMGNSPLEVTRVYADELVLATTNGVPALHAAHEHAQLVLLGCLLNLGAVVTELDGADVLFICSGTDGAPALEDVWVAGRMCALLDGARTDAALIAQSVAAAQPSALAALGASANAQVLEAAGLGDDIAFCARTSVVTIVPRVTGARDGVARVVAGPERPIDGAGTLTVMPISEQTR